ncbi:BnaC05g36770D [Brassica napus]|uniref:BnaC05g36770D protein n=1 Tax=Brassica napus TaxID=3708 RepID=A0A078HX99_BRANA|nr:BnaC05g36770D [Brassica napus]
MVYCLLLRTLLLLFQ